MYVGICRLDLMLSDCSSLKDKRQVIRSLIERLKSRFNISIAEVGFLDLLRRSEIGFSVVSNETRHLESLMGKVVNFIEGDSRVQIVSIHKEIH
jgi:uncharacterized protein